MEMIQKFEKKSLEYENLGCEKQFSNSRSNFYNVKGSARRSFQREERNNIRIFPDPSSLRILS